MDAHVPINISTDETERQKVNIRSTGGLSKKTPQITIEKEESDIDDDVVSNSGSESTLDIEPASDESDGEDEKESEFEKKGDNSFNFDNMANLKKVKKENPEERHREPSENSFSTESSFVVKSITLSGKTI